MTKIVVDPKSVKAYGAAAQADFDKIRTELVQLVNDVTQVDYHGTNAHRFKTECGQMAAEFSAKLLKDAGAIADAVRTATSNIATSLGGAPIQIKVDGRAIPLPAVAKSDVEIADTSALTQLIPVVRRRFTAIDAALNSHLRSLSGTNWQGDAKAGAVKAVGSFTKKVVATGNEAETSITKFISDQVQAAQAADKSLQS